MAEISVGEAVGEGFKLIRRRPLAVLTWGLFQTGLALLGFVLIAPMFGEMMREAQARASGLSAAPDLQGMMRTQSLTYLIDLVNLMASAVTWCAVSRAVLRPEQGAFAYLRLGASELLLALLFFAAAIAFGVGLVVALIPIMIVVFILTATHLGAVAAIFGVVAGVAAVVVLIYMLLRISLIGPMMVDVGGLPLSQAWALTKGKVTGLLAIGLVLTVILIAGELVLSVILVAVGIGVLSSVAGGLQNLPQLFQQQPQAILGKLLPLLVVLGVIWIPISGCVMAVMGAPWARAYRDLRPNRDIAETFA
jgi:hypothetical protein